MTDMTDDELDAIEAKARAATPGPWRHREKLDDGTEWHDVLSDEADRGITDCPDWGIVACGAGGDGDATSMEASDAAFIAAANPAAVLALVAEIRRLRRSPWEIARRMGEGEGK